MFNIQVDLEPEKKIKKTESPPEKQHKTIHDFFGGNKKEPESKNGSEEQEHKSNTEPSSSKHKGNTHYDISMRGTDRINHFVRKIQNNVWNYKYKMLFISFMSS